MSVDAPFSVVRKRNPFCFIERHMRSRLLSEISRSGRHRWLQVDEMPFSRAVTYKLIDAGLISSVVVSWPGSKRGRRLIDGDSLDLYLEGLTEKQALADVNRPGGQACTIRRAGGFKANGSNFGRSLE
jgi:hypothetical protein